MRAPQRFWVAIVFLAVGQGIFGALARGHGTGVAARQAGQEVATDYAAHFNRGDQLMRQLELYGAIAEFREAVRLNPDHLPSHYALALAYAARATIR